MVMVIHLEVHPLIRRELLDPDVIFTEHKKKERKLFTGKNLNLKQENGKAVITNRIVKEIFTVNCCVIS